MVGGGAPIVVQSMTNTDTADAVATARQVQQLAAAGSELVRITVNNEESAAQVAAIREKLDAMGCSVPLVGDFHFIEESQCQQNGESHYQQRMIHRKFRNLSQHKPGN